jgi:hypothetical protein
MAIVVYLYVVFGMMRVFYMHQAERIVGDWDECIWEGALWPIWVAADIEAWWIGERRK